MEQEYYEQLYFRLLRKYYQQFDRFITVRWGDCEDPAQIGPEDRDRAYKVLYAKIKNAHVANRQTIRRWFGLGGRTLPTRTQIIKLALATGLSISETVEYLQYGISQPGFQENEYREFIAMYCLDHKMGLEKCQEMIRFYEKKCHMEGGWEQISHTDWLREQYDIVKQYSEEEFLVWMYKNQKYFKGYSLTVLNYYRELMDQCLQIFRRGNEGDLINQLEEYDFFSWLKKVNDGYYDDEIIEQCRETGKIQQYIRVKDIERFVKNRLRSPGTDNGKMIDPMDAVSMRNSITIVYASRDRICDLIVGVYSEMPIWKKTGKKYKIYRTLRDQLQRVDAKYLSEMLNIAILKEQQMRIQMEIARTMDPKEKEKLESKWRKSKARVHLINRSDLLILVQYIICDRYRDAISAENIDKNIAREDFINFANGIMESCGMRKIDESYMLDDVLLLCLDESCAFSEVISSARDFDDSKIGLDETDVADAVDEAVGPSDLCSTEE